MTVGDLKKLLEGVDDEILVCIPLELNFTGAFYKPCTEESGLIQLGLNENLADEDWFALVPVGFFDDSGIDETLN